jgi:NifB/MoaA-like Fe-S oxidoreductase
MTLSSDLLAPIGWTVETAADGVFVAGTGLPGADVVRVPALLPSPRLIPARQIQENRFQVRLDRRELGNVQALVSKQPGDNCQVQPLITQTDFEQSTGQRLDGEA